VLVSHVQVPCCPSCSTDVSFGMKETFGSHVRHFKLLPLLPTTAESCVEIILLDLVYVKGVWFVPLLVSRLPW
jgi:hypothetical protein